MKTRPFSRFLSDHRTPSPARRARAGEASRLTASIIPLLLGAACSSSLTVDNSEDERDAGGPGTIETRDGSAGPGPQGSGPGIIGDPDEETPEPCGDATLDDGENCDDGNTDSGDGCSADCELEDGFACPVVGASCMLATVCGDSRQTGDEQCDDGNTTSGDGCTETCLLEANFACPEPGEDCVTTVHCGDSTISGPETCDDGNTNDGDGCDDECMAEPGFQCSTAGFPCQAICGDSEVNGRETCDDGNTDDGDGCSATCQREFGYACTTPGEACYETECGDGIPEGDEPCDDGDDIHVGDGCSPGCKLEPTCAPPMPLDPEPEPEPEPEPIGDAGMGDAGIGDAGTIDNPEPAPIEPVAVAGVCSSACGDGLILAGDNEECDDGNSVSGDGCDENCRIEDGWYCELESSELPEELVLPVVYRDFIHNTSEDTELSRHPDFQEYSGNAATPGLVERLLGADGKPVYTGQCEAGQPLDENLCPYDEQTTSEEDFEQWYQDTENVNIAVLDGLTFDQQPDGTYVFDGEGGLFPLDDLGWVATDPPDEDTSDGHNFGFTTELRHWFEFQGGEFLEFEGDDDVWVFIGGQLVVDIGGLHPSTDASVTLDEETAAALGLEVGRIYEIVLFHAERHTSHSNFRLTIGGFISAETTCETDCGDGVVAGDELCDDGEMNGAGYGFCNEDCTPGERCGDGVVNGDEVCDDGVNLAGYTSADGEPACAPGCVLPPRCGDGSLDSNFGEQCDDGEDNDGSYDGCDEDCSLGPRCGDGVINGDEACDDGNNSNRDDCDVECRIIPSSMAR